MVCDGREVDRNGVPVEQVLGVLVAQVAVQVVNHGCSISHVTT